MDRQMELVDDHCSVTTILAENSNELNQKVQNFLNTWSFSPKLRLGSISHHTEPAFASAMVVLVHRRREYV